VTTGLRFQRASEDPASAAQTLDLRSRSRALEQYQRNIGLAQSRLRLEEGALDQVTGLLTRARELAVAGASDTINPAARRSSANEVNELLAQAVNLANTKAGGEYLFGGDQSRTAPFSLVTSGTTLDFSATPGAGIGGRAVEIGAGQVSATVHDGATAFGDGTSGSLRALANLASALATGDRDTVATALSPVVTALEDLQAIVAETGARANQMEVASANLSAFGSQLDAIRSDISEVDLDQAVSEMVTRQTAYQAALSATSRVLNLSLTDYLT
jgi:flagellar hook-associated protein 3 FlgL